MFLIFPFKGNLVLFFLHDTGYVLSIALAEKMQLNIDPSVLFFYLLIFYLLIFFKQVCIFFIWFCGLDGIVGLFCVDNGVEQIFSPHLPDLVPSLWILVTVHILMTKHNSESSLVASF